MGMVAHSHFAAERVSVHSPWRAGAFEAADREQTLRALIREAQEYGAHSVADVLYAVEEARCGACESVKLRRLVASGRPVRFALPA